MIEIHSFALRNIINKYLTYLHLIKHNARVNIYIAQVQSMEFSGKAR